MKKGLIVVMLLTLVGTALGNEAQRILSSMTDSARKTAFANMLNSSGERCGTATRAFFRGSDKDRHAYWSVACSSGKSFQVQVKSDAGGSTVIADCAVLKAIAKIDCFKAF